MAEPSRLRGVRYGSATRHADARGAFREVWRASTSGEDAAFVQANLSSSVVGVLRGLHLHRRQVDHWFVGAGRAFVALVDVRPMLELGAVGPAIETRELGPDDWVVIPSGVAHGFLALDPLELIYLVTNEFDGSDELGFAWDDPLAAVPWPPIPTSLGSGPLLSDRDRSNPSLLELVVRLRHDP